MNFQKLNITDLHLADYNPRKGLKPADSEYHADMTVIGGHQRVKVLKDPGYEEIDCVVLNIDK